MLSENSEESELLQALALDVNKHFSCLMTRYNSQLFRFVVHKVKDQDMADDILQDCWIRVYQALLQYSAERIRSLELQAWLYTIARNQIYTYFRKKNAASTISTEDLGDTLMDNVTLPPEEMVEIKRQVEIVERTIEQLPPISRAVLRLYLLDGLSPQEIATQLGLTVSNVRTHVFRGRRELRKKLATSIN
jgi:RNA polymerase sigma-70 factor (ECF subfamily)